MDLSAGKLVNLKRIADEAGRFKMMAIDQRGSLERVLAELLGKERKETVEDMVRVKEVITRLLASYSTAILMDPIYGFPYSVSHLPSHVGFLLAAEETGYEAAGPSQRERESSLIREWSAQKAKRAGANAVKLRIYYNPDGSPEVRAHQ